MTWGRFHSGDFAASGSFESHIVPTDYPSHPNQNQIGNSRFMKNEPIYI